MRELAAELQMRGRSVFWDRRIPAGQTWRSFVGRALTSSRCVVVVWSEAAVTSDWVIEEADHGKHRGVLVPVRKEPVAPPIGFGQIQAADLTIWVRDGSSNEFAAFLRDLAEVIGRAIPEVEMAGSSADGLAPEPLQVHLGGIGTTRAIEYADPTARHDPEDATPAGANADKGARVTDIEETELRGSWLDLAKPFLGCAVTSGVVWLLLWILIINNFVDALFSYFRDSLWASLQLLMLAALLTAIWYTILRIVLPLVKSWRMPRQVQFWSVVCGPTVMLLLVFHWNYGMIWVYYWGPLIFYPQFIMYMVGGYFVSRRSNRPARKDHLMSESRLIR